MDETPTGVLRNQHRITMKKLLDRYRKNPSSANALAIVAYDQRHPFASLLLLDIEDRLLVARLLSQATVGGLA